MILSLFIDLRMTAMRGVNKCILITLPLSILLTLVGSKRVLSMSDYNTYMSPMPVCLLLGT